MSRSSNANASGPPRRPPTLDVDGTVEATFGLANGGRLPAPVPLREAVGLLVDAWDEAADWNRYEADAEPRASGESPPPLGWHPPLAPRRFSESSSEIIRAYHAGIRPPPPPKPSERFGDE